MSGGRRAGSGDRKLLCGAVPLFGDATGAEAGTALPLYKGDDEDAEGGPAAAQILADQIAAADGVLISSPEYNKAIPGGLKNALDWVSRTKGGPWLGKPVALMSAAAGRTGGETGLYTVRHALTAFRPRIVTAPAIMVAGAQNGFDDTGTLVNERTITELTGLMEALKAEIDLHK